MAAVLTTKPQSSVVFNSIRRSGSSDDINGVVFNSIRRSGSSEDLKGVVFNSIRRSGSSSKDNNELVFNSLRRSKHKNDTTKMEGGIISKADADETARHNDEVGASNIGTAKISNQSNGDDCEIEAGNGTHHPKRVLLSSFLMKKLKKVSLKTKTAFLNDALAFEQRGKKQQQCALREEKKAAAPSVDDHNGDSGSFPISDPAVVETCVDGNKGSSNSSNTTTAAPKPIISTGAPASKKDPQCRVNEAEHILGAVVEDRDDDGSFVFKGSTAAVTRSIYQSDTEDELSTTSGWSHASGHSTITTKRNAMLARMGSLLTTSSSTKNDIITAEELEVSGLISSKDDTVHARSDLKRGSSVNNADHTLNVVDERDDANVFCWYGVC